jgi:hypothetical protein
MKKIKYAVAALFIFTSVTGMAQEKTAGKNTVPVSQKETPKSKRKTGTKMKEPVKVKEGLKTDYNTGSKGTNSSTKMKAARKPVQKHEAGQGK